MQAYIDSICNRSTPPTAAAVRPTKSALLLQSHQLERKRQLDYKAAQEMALQAGKARHGWELTPQPSHSRSVRRVRSTSPVRRSRVGSTASFSNRIPRAFSPNVSTPYRRVVNSDGNAGRAGPISWPKRAPHPLGLPPTSPAHVEAEQQHRQNSNSTSNYVRMWTPYQSSLFSAQQTPRQRQKHQQQQQQQSTASLSTRDRVHDASPSQLSDSPWHPLFSNSPSPTTSPSMPRRLTKETETAVVRENVAHNGDGDSFSPVCARANHSHARESKRAGQPVQLKSAPLPEAGQRNVCVVASRNVQHSQSSSLPFPLAQSAPHATWTSWHPRNEEKPAHATQTDLTSSVHPTGVAHYFSTNKNANDVVAPVQVNHAIQRESPSQQTLTVTTTPPYVQRISADPISANLASDNRTDAVAAPSSAPLFFTGAPGYSHSSPLTPQKIIPEHSQLSRSVRDDSTTSTEPRFPAASSLSGHLNYLKVPQSIRRPPTQCRYHRNGSFSGLKSKNGGSLRDLHECLLFRLHSHPRDASTTSEGKSDGVSGSTESVLASTAAAVELWRTTRDLHKCLEMERDLICVKAENEEADREGSYGAHCVWNFVTGSGALRGGQRRTSAERAMASTRAYLYTRESEDEDVAYLSRN